MANQDSNQKLFQRLKAVCVPLLGSSLLTAAKLANVYTLLGELIDILHDSKGTDSSLNSNLISYVFFPLSTLLRRNAISDIPDYILEKVFIALSMLCDDWWWECDLAVWEQIFILCGAVLSGASDKGKEKERDAETKEAATRCLLSLLRPQNQEDSASMRHERLENIKSHTRADKFMPILGQMLDALLAVVETPHMPLQRVCLESLYLLIEVYASDDLIPSVLPGVVSRMTRVAIGTSSRKGWLNGESVAGCLKVMQVVVVKGIGDEVCAKTGAIQRIIDLEDLGEAPLDHIGEPVKKESRPFSVSRTPSWLRGTSTQLLIALNSLTSLLTHPTPSALSALSEFSAFVLRFTSLTFPDAQSLLLHWLLSLSGSGFSSVSTGARNSLLSLLLATPDTQHSLQQKLLRITNENLLALPRLLPIHADSKVQHAAGIVETVCNLAFLATESTAGLASISKGVAKLLGPSGGIEKWGWSLLSVLELFEPPIIVSHTSSALLALEGHPLTSHFTAFPRVQSKNMFLPTTIIALERMFRALGKTAGDSCLFSVEWFISTGHDENGSVAATAIWCACRLLEGAANLSLDEIPTEISEPRRSKRLAKFARALARNVAEIWDDQGEQHGPKSDREDDRDVNSLVQHVKGVAMLDETLRLTGPSRTRANPSIYQPGLCRAFLLQLISISAGILQAQFPPLLLYTFYPILRSLVSSDTFLSTSALATIEYITVVTSYASPANLLLSNFDYALDAISRRLSRRWLDIEATKVLGLIVRLVGGDIALRAGDIVGECFDRLDEFHGYNLVVEGLIEVLEDVIKAVKDDTAIMHPKRSKDTEESAHDIEFPDSMDDFFHWFSHRLETTSEELDATDYGPAPRKAWGENQLQQEENDTSGKFSSETEHFTPTQSLTKDIISRSLYYLTHGSPAVRARILALLASSVPVLPESALLPSIHYAWPFILNRLSDSESYVVSSAATLVESMAVHFGDFMFRRVWDDVWPKFRTLLDSLSAAEKSNALSRRGVGAVGTESAYTHSHRTYNAMIRTMTAAVIGVRLHETRAWELLLAFRRFLHKDAHEELQRNARSFYLRMARQNPDAVWLVLSSTIQSIGATTDFLVTPLWDIQGNATVILRGEA